MNEPNITKQMLIDAGACRDHVALFEKTFGESVTVTAERAGEVAHLFDWTWAVRLLDAPAWAESERVRAAAWDEYERVETTAWDEYERVKATAWAAAFINMHKRRASQ
jgi:hypothetical protein